MKAKNKVKETTRQKGEKVEGKQGCNSPKLLAESTSGPSTYLKFQTTSQWTK